MHARPKYFAIAAVLLVLAIIAAGCGGSSNPPAATQAAAAATTEAAKAAEATTAAAAATTEAAKAAEATTAAAAATTEAAKAAEATTAAAAATTEAATQAAAAAGATRTFQLTPGQSTAQYEVAEEFLGAPIPFVQTIGKTNAVDGKMVLDISGSTVKLADNQFTVDLRTLTSDRPRRDSMIKEHWLESNKYPTATFVAKDVAELPADAALGKDVAFKVSGDMTIHDTTKPLTWNMTAKIDSDKLTGQAQTYLLMKDFGFDAPDIAGMLKVTDGVTVTVNFAGQEVK